MELMEVSLPLLAAYISAFGPCQTVTSSSSLCSRLRTYYEDKLAVLVTDLHAFHDSSRVCKLSSPLIDSQQVNCYPLWFQSQTHYLKMRYFQWLCCWIRALLAYDAPVSWTMAQAEKWQPCLRKRPGVTSSADCRSCSHHRIDASKMDGYSELQSCLKRPRA